MNLFMLYGQQFTRYWPIFKIVMTLGQLAKVPEVAHIFFFLPQGVEIELIFAVRAVVSEIPIFKIAIFGHET